MADEEEQDCCPLCMEELDITDKTFDACPCGYQVCLWCWHQIKNEYNGLCPACRTPYSEISKQKNTLDREDVVRRTKQRKQKEKSDRRNAAQSNKQTINRKNLANVRVMQRNLVYVIGLPQHFAEEEILRSLDCFGQYGKIIKAVVNKSHLSADRSNATASAYITFSNKEDALVCIIAIDGYYLDGSLLRASFGTTKYCNFFLRNLQCNNPDCLYLHELGDQDDSFTKEEMQSALHSGKAAFRESTMNGGLPEVRAGSDFPPPYRPQAAAAATAENADAQRKAQSAAAIYKLKQSAHRSDSGVSSSASSSPGSTTTTSARPITSEPYSKIVAGGNAASSSGGAPTIRVPTPEPTMAEKLMETNRSAPSVAQSEDSRKPNLRVDTSSRENVSVEETVVGPLEALKLATGSTVQEPAWAQPFPSPSVVQPDQDDSSVVGGVFSPFGLGFDGGIRHGGIANQEPDHMWGSSASFKGSNHENDPLGTGGDVFAQPLPMPASAPSSSLSFASIDAIFSQRNESSEALAGLLGVQLAATPLSHGTPQAKNSRSSRFAFANQPSGLDIPSSPAPPQSTGMNGVPSSPFGMMEPPNRRIQSPFGYGTAVGLGNNNPSSFPMHHDASAFPPLGSHHHAPAPSPFGNGFRGNSLQSGGENNNDSVGSGLAFLQQMLPNVNISYGGDYPSHSGSAGNNSGMFPEMSNAGNNASSSAWSGGSLNSLGFNSGAGRSSSGFYDPALVSHSAAPSGGFFGLGSSLDSDNDRHHLHTSLGGVAYRHSGSIMNNGN